MKNLQNEGYQILTASESLSYEQFSMGCLAAVFALPLREPRPELSYLR